MTYSETGAARAAKKSETDGKAVIGFISGLVGLLFGNIVLGPIAIALGTMALRGSTGRRGRAALAIALGVADLVLFAVLAVHSANAHGSVVWRLAAL